jgi:hypothetical protein
LEVCFRIGSKLKRREKLETAGMDKPFKQSKETEMLLQVFEGQ